MKRPYDGALVGDFLKHHWTYRPVDATFMGTRGYDDKLPPVGLKTLADELTEIERLEEKVKASEEPVETGDRLDRRTMLAELALQRQVAHLRPRFHNPAWFSGEAAFAVISLLLPQSLPLKRNALIARLAAIPAFLTGGAEWITGRAVPKSWALRAQREALAMAEFLRNDLGSHESFTDAFTAEAKAAALAFERFALTLTGLPDANPACGERHLAFLMRDVHGLAMTPDEALARAEAAFARMGGELEAIASAVDPARSSADILASLAERHPADAAAVMASYRDWDRRALSESGHLVTPASDYGLDYRWMAPSFRKVARALYFLFYRSPPGLDAGKGSVYWLTPPEADEQSFLASNPTAMIKIVHAVHHGSIGHHTQNAKARRAKSRLARIAGTDCALGLAFLSSGTLVEGWACYAQDLMLEAKGFYDLDERLLLKQFERRNAASVLVDVRLHKGEWTLDEARGFYRDKAGFAPARVESEVVRNSMLPGSRLMYWLGIEAIKELRRRWKGTVLDFHNELLSYGHVPVSWIGAEMERAGQLKG